MVREAIFPRTYYLITFPNYLERKERLQPVIEKMANKLNITHEGLPDRWERVRNLRISDD